MQGFNAWRLSVKSVRERDAPLLPRMRRLVAEDAAKTWRTLPPTFLTTPKTPTPGLRARYSSHASHASWLEATLGRRAGSHIGSVPQGTWIVGVKSFRGAMPAANSLWKLSCSPSCNSPNARSRSSTTTVGLASAQPAARHAARSTIANHVSCPHAAAKIEHCRHWPTYFFVPRSSCQCFP